MSLILDALKKLEQEKTTRKDGAVNVAAEILRTERPQHRRKGTALLVVAVVSAGLAVIAVLALQGGTGARKPSSPPAPAAPPTAIPAPLPPAPPPKPAEPPAPLPPAAIGKEELLPPPAKPAEAPPPPVVSRPQPAKAPANKELDIPENVSNGSIMHLRVLGIVWQEERSGRRAFVNGSIAAEGSMIDGTRIVEIYPNRIRFSRGGRFFDIPLEKTP